MRERARLVGRSRHVAQSPRQYPRLVGKELLVELITAKSVRQFSPMVEAARAGEKLKPEIRQSLAVAIALFAVETTDRISSLRYSFALEKTSHVNLRST